MQFLNNHKCINISLITAHITIFRTSVLKQKILKQKNLYWWLTTTLCWRKALLLFFFFFPSNMEYRTGKKGSYMSAYIVQIQILSKMRMVIIE